jgi:hypothetical protein
MSSNSPLAPIKWVLKFCTKFFILNYCSWAGISEIEHFFYENNYHVAAGLKEAHKEPLKNFKKHLDSLKFDLKRSGINSNDGVKFYWIPDDFENRVTNGNELLNENSSFSPLI